MATVATMPRALVPKSRKLRNHLTCLLDSVPSGSGEDLATGASDGIVSLCRHATENVLTRTITTLRGQDLRPLLVRLRPKPSISQ